MRNSLLRFLLSCALLVLAPSQLSAARESAVALVVGNSAYRFAPELRNPRNDAADIAALLRKLGFRVLEGLDLDKSAMDNTIRTFADALVGVDNAVFFYAGHGLQVSEQNYLVPVDAKLATPTDLDFEVVRLDVIQRAMERSAKANVLFIDGVPLIFPVQVIETSGFVMVDPPANPHARSMPPSIACYLFFTGQSPCFFRPPGGFPDNVLPTVQQLGMSAVLWSIDTLDWRQPGALSAASTNSIVAAATNNGGAPHPIVLMHDAKASHEADSVVSPFRGNTVAALPRIIAAYRAAGFQFVDLNGGSGLRGHNTDFSGDQLGDVLATRPDGSLWAYRGNGANGWQGWAPVGSGWQIADAMFAAGDFAGDGHPAVLYRRKDDGSLWMWTTDGAGGWGATRSIGGGWNACSALFSPGDFDGDGHPDVMCLRRGPRGTATSLGTTNTGQPARWAAAVPVTESSMARHASGCSPSNAAAR